MSTKPLLILGSASPRRKELLAPHFRLRLAKPDIDESPQKGEAARSYVRRMARSKWEMLCARQYKAPILTADTIVVLGGKILGKPAHRHEARKMLRLLSGNTHEVITAVCFGNSRSLKPQHLFHVVTKIRFRNLSTLELEAYLKSGEWKGKAGAYAIQGKAAHFVAEIRGSLTNVIGLPLERVLHFF